MQPYFRTADLHVNTRKKIFLKPVDSERNTKQSKPKWVDNSVDLEEYQSTWNGTAVPSPVVFFLSLFVLKFLFKIKDSCLMATMFWSYRKPQTNKITQRPMPKFLNYKKPLTKIRNKIKNGQKINFV
jgi:hypothetical protein